MSEDPFQRQGRPPTYPWDHWIAESLDQADGPDCHDGVHKLHRERDFPTAQTTSFRVRAHQVAKDYGLRVRTKIVDDGEAILLEFYEPDEA